MNDELRQRVIQALQRGEDLPSDWARELFPPEKREYELVYYGKEREEDIIAGTMAVPLQAERTFGKNGVDWHNMLIFGDNLQVMKTLLEQKKAGKLCNADGTPGVRLIYIDPPFATKRDFLGSQDQKAYQDKIAGASFIEFLRKRLILLRELLADDGFLVVHIDYRYGHYIKIILDELFPGGFRNDITVPRGTKNVQNQFEEITALTVGDDSLFLYAKSRRAKLPHLRIDLEEQAAGKWDTFWRGTDRKTMRYRLFAQKPETGQWRWKESRALEASENYQTYLKNYADKESLDDYYLRHLESGGGLNFVRLNEENVVQYYVPPRDSRIASTIWSDIRTLGKATNYPTEKHEELLFRLAKWLSQSGDLLLDAFAGSGTTLAVAEKLGRRWIGIDCGKLAIYTIQKRMLNLKAEIGNKGAALKLQPFTLYNAGLYDFSKLKQLPWSDWRFFCLQLFGCKEELHTIGGLQLDGKLKGASVLVFNHHEKPGVGIDEETVRSIHAAVGKKIGRKFYIIAPRGVFGFQQDYIDLDGVRYYAMRVPYSIINELHQREFTALKQPNDETAVNDTVDSVGFDFIQPPKVKWSVGANACKGQLIKEAFLKVDKFESRARLRGEDTHGGMETFSMLMLDFDYDGDVFDLDAVFYNHQIEEAGWEARFSAESLGNNVMAVFIDTHGNEAREVIPIDQFGLQPAKPVTKKTKAKLSHAT